MFHSSLGTVVQETSNFLVEEKIIASPTTSITFSNLDIVKDGGYRLELLLATGGATSPIYSYINGDTTAANYYYTRGQFYGSTVSSSSAAGAFIFEGADANAYSVCQSDIYLVKGRTRIISNIFRDYSTSLAQPQILKYIPVISNITSITIATGSTFEAGTVLRLYRKKVGVPSAFPSASGMLVADIVVPSNTSQVDITGLDGNLHGGYEIVTNFLAAGGTTEYLACWINGDTTPSNYTFRNVYGNGTSALSSTPTYHAVGFSYNTRRSGGMTNINPSPYPCLTSSVWGNSSPTPALSILTAASYVGASHSNITSLLFTTPSANMIAAGTTIQVYRRK